MSITKILTCVAIAVCGLLVTESSFGQSYLANFGNRSYVDYRDGRCYQNVNFDMNGPCSATGCSTGDCGRPDCPHCNCPSGNCSYDAGRGNRLDYPPRNRVVPPLQSFPRDDFRNERFDISPERRRVPRNEYRDRAPLDRNFRNVDPDDRVPRIPELPQGGLHSRDYIPNRYHDSQRPLGRYRNVDDDRYDDFVQPRRAPRRHISPATGFDYSVLFTN